MAHYFRVYYSMPECLITSLYNSVSELLNTSLHSILLCVPKYFFSACQNDSIFLCILACQNGSLFLSNMACQNGSLLSVYNSVPEWLNTSACQNGSILLCIANHARMLTIYFRVYYSVPEWLITSVYIY